MNPRINVLIVLSIAGLLLMWAPAVLLGWRLQQMLIYWWALAVLGAVGLFLDLRHKRMAVPVMLTLLVVLGGLALLMRQYGVW